MDSPEYTPVEFVNTFDLHCNSELRRIASSHADWIFPWSEVTERIDIEKIDEIRVRTTTWMADDFRTLCELQGQSVSEVLRQLMKTYMQHHPMNEKKPSHGND